MNRNIPYFKQQNDAYCGPACLQMIVGRDGIRLRQRQAAYELNTSFHSGTSRRGFARALRRFGYAVEASANQTFSDIQKYLERGWTVLVNYREPEEGIGHFAVVVGLTSQDIILSDPEHGRALRLKRGWFVKHWYGHRSKRFGHWLLAAKKR